MRRTASLDGEDCYNTFTIAELPATQDRVWPRRTTIKILIAEDDAVVRHVLQRSLQRRGHECLAASDGAAAWELFRNAEVEIVFSDWMMPGLDGAELCRRVRQQKGGYAYFVFLSSLGEKRHILQGMIEGADDYLTKPLDPDDLDGCLIAAGRVVSLHRNLCFRQEELERLNRECAKLARVDPLTRVGNRLRLQEDLVRMQARARRYGHGCVAAILDIDFFKGYNDLYGHPRGDEVLRAVAKELCRQVRRSDGVYRYGGEEFILLLSDQSLHMGTQAMERIRRAVEALSIPHPSGPAGVLTVSCGVAEQLTGEETAPGVLLEQADEALYFAKREGRNRVEVFLPGRRRRSGAGDGL